MCTHTVPRFGNIWTQCPHTWVHVDSHSLPIFGYMCTHTFLILGYTCTHPVQIIGYMCTHTACIPEYICTHSPILGYMCTHTVPILGYMCTHCPHSWVPLCTDTLSLYFGTCVLAQTVPILSHVCTDSPQNWVHINSHNVHSYIPYTWVHVYSHCIYTLLHIYSHAVPILEYMCTHMLNIYLSTCVLTQSPYMGTCILMYSHCRQTANRWTGTGQRATGCPGYHSGRRRSFPLPADYWTPGDPRYHCQTCGTGTWHRQCPSTAGKGFQSWNTGKYRNKVNISHLVMSNVRAIGLFFKMWLDILPWTLHSFDHNILF